MSVETAAVLLENYLVAEHQDYQDLVRAHAILQQAIVLSITEGQVRAIITTCRDLDHAADSMISFLRSRGIPVWEGS